MERKIRLLAIAGLFCSGSHVCHSQGFVLKDCTQKTQQSTVINEYNTYNFSQDSVLELPPYAYESSTSFIKNYTTISFPQASCNNEVKRIASNLPAGRNLHYLYSSNFLFILSPETGLLIVKDLESKSITWANLNGLPFGIAYSEPRNELYISGLKSRSVHVYSPFLNLKDSIVLNGASGRFMALQNGKLFIGVRSSKSITKVNLENRKLESFQITSNKPGPIIIDSFNNVYFIQKSSTTIISKFDAENLGLLESRKLRSYLQEVSFSNNQIHLEFDANCLLLKDTLAGNQRYYGNSSLDSSGRYTWVINSYTNPKWALATKVQFEEAGIKCYLSSLNDGFVRLCAGLYQNQELAVKEKNLHDKLFDGAWLMTIHPHKF